MKSPKTQIWNFETHKYETLNEDDHNSSVATVGDGTLPWHIWSQRSLVLYGPTLHYSITILHSSFVFVLMVQHCFITFFGDMNLYFCTFFVFLYLYSSAVQFWTIWGTLVKEAPAESTDCVTAWLQHQSWSSSSVKTEESSNNDDHHLWWWRWRSSWSSWVMVICVKLD